MKISLLLLCAACFVSCKTMPDDSAGSSVLTDQDTSDIYVDSFWTGNTAYGLHRLSSIRNTLIKKNLIDNNSGKSAAIKCQAYPPLYRTYDGTCYSKAFPTSGSAGQRFGRNSTLDKAVVDRQNLLTPNPRAISTTLMKREAFIPATTLNLLAAAWIQFMVHDWANHEKDAKNPLRFKLERGNPFNAQEMTLPSTPSDRKANEKFASSRNTETAWWDGSQVYGSSVLIGRSLRAKQGGKLTLTRDNLLPLDRKTGQPQTGFTDNWWLGLSLLHHIFALEHNRIATMLASKYPRMSDEEIFQKARLINAALMSKIHTVEWTPAVLQHPILNAAMNTNWYGLLTNIELPSKYLAKLLPARLGFLHGIVGLPVTREFGVPYSLTEEFVTVYRMHQFLPDRIQAYSSSGQVERTYALKDTARRSSQVLLKNHGLQRWIYSFAKQNPGALVLNNYPEFLRNLPMPDSMNIDLAAVDVLRDRERGVPRYNEFRRQLRLKPIEDFSDITDNEKHVAQLRSLYKNVEEIDTIVGMMAEGHRPPGFAFGETQFRIFVLMASRRLFSDPFYTRLYKKEVYTREGLDWVENETLGSVIAAHFPQLKSFFGKEKNAFLPLR